MSAFLTLAQFYEELKTVPGRNIVLNENQLAIIEHGTGPLWIIAGPGSGKTEVLVLRCLKLILVDGIDPRSIMITTFTEKAARNLSDRLISYKAHISIKYPSVSAVDLFQLRVGTLHSLCNSIMLEYRFPGYKNYRPLDDLDQLLFIYFHCLLVIKSENGKKNRLSSEEIQFWKYFTFVWGRGKGRMYANKDTIPSRWIRARALQTMFNRIAEDLIDIEKMKKARSEWRILAEAYEQYAKSLNEHFRVDFAHIQLKFVKFLDHEMGKRFIQGDQSADHPGLKYILVDEYQDTNPIQEEIYLKLGRNHPHNLSVVGDDDQALYRFRGGTVECMINFGKTIKERFGVDVKKIALVNNYRSHKDIVKWYNEYITSFDVMKRAGARAPGKPDLVAKSSISGTYPAVSVITGKAKIELAQKFAELVRGLIDNKIVNDPSECVLLMRSTKENRNWAGPFTQALAEKDIVCYNPRAGRYIEQEEIKVALGAFLSIVDPKPSYDMVANWIQSICNSWRQEYERVAGNPKNKKLKDYVERSAQLIKSLKLKQGIKTPMQEILYHIINHQPFVEWLEDPERTVRLGQLTRLFESYALSPVPGKKDTIRGHLSGSSQKQGEISWMWRLTFYNSFVTLIAEEGLNDPEDEEDMFPKGYLPVMTVHQAKGLEFPFVFVAGLDARDEPGTEHLLEAEMLQFRQRPIRLAPADERVKQDSIRFYYVAYSRARFALIMLAIEDDLKVVVVENQPEGIGGKGKTWLNALVKRLD